MYARTDVHKSYETDTFNETSTQLFAEMSLVFDGDHRTILHRIINLWIKSTTHII